MNEPARALADSVPAMTESKAATLGFDEVFTLHHRAVYRTAYALVRDAGLAEDVTQEVFLRFYRHQDSAPTDELLRPWLLRVAINTAHNTLRGRRRAFAREEEFAKAAVGNGVAAAKLDDEYERRIEIEEARRTLDRIGEPARTCLLLKQQGLSYREIAAAARVSEGNVGSIIARGRKEFMRLYGKIGGHQ